MVSSQSSILRHQVESVFSRQGLLLRLLSGERGQGMVEYALIVSLIAMALIVGLGTTQVALADAMDWISTSIDGASSR